MTWRSASTMTIQTLTSNPQEDPGLPDLGALSRLANEFFASLPGGAAPSAQSASGAAPASGAPTLAAHEAPLQPAPAGIADGYDLGTPEAYTAAIPQVYPGASIAAPAGGGSPASPFYFVGESNPHQ